VCDQFDSEMSREATSVNNSCGCSAHIISKHLIFSYIQYYKSGKCLEWPPIYNSTAELDESPFSLI